MELCYSPVMREQPRDFVKGNEVQSYMKGIQNDVMLKIGMVLLGLLVLSSCSTPFPLRHDGETILSSDSRLEGGLHTIATVNGEPIVKAEYHLAQNLPIFRTSSQRDQSQDTNEGMIRVKLLQLEGVKHGLMPSASYEDFQTRLKRENERRELALEKKEVIYGPRQYTEQTFYMDEFSRLENGIKEMISKTNLVLFEDTLLQEYERNKSEYEIQPTIVLKKWVEPITSNEEDAHQRIKALYRDLMAGKNVDKLLSSTNVNPEKADEETISEENKRNYLKYREAFFERANKLEVGQFSDIFIDQGNYVIVYCSNRMERGYKSLAEVHDEVYHKTLDKQFQEYIDRLRESADVQYLE